MLPPLLAANRMMRPVSAFLHGLDEIVRRTTAAPARIMGYEGTVGTLKPGANADVAVFGLREGSFELKDSDGNVVTAKRRLLFQTTIKDGRIWYERPAGE